MELQGPEVRASAVERNVNLMAVEVVA